jgi:hypothetical protein
VFGELSKNIELFFCRQPRVLLSLLKSPNSFISLRGSKEPQSHSARAKPRVNRLIRTAQKTKKHPNDHSGRGALSSSKKLAVSANASGFHQLQ